MQTVDFQELPISDLLERQPVPGQVGIRRYRYSNQGKAAMHRHNFYTMELILEGKCSQYINGYLYECGPGSLCMLSPFDYHQFQFGKEDVSACCLSFTEDVLTEEVLERLNAMDGPCFMQLSEEELAEFNRELQILEKELARKQPLYRSAMDGAVNRLVIFLLRREKPERLSVDNRKSDIRYSIPYIRRHFREPLTLAEIAETFNVTQNHFCKYFKKITGITFKEYLLQLRLEYAMKQILLTQDSITDICFESGFNSPSYFTKVFRARFGKTPSECRNN